jgi:hypothetical protein
MKTKQTHDIQVKDKLQGKECWLREAFKLIVAAIEKLGNPSMNFKNDLDECLTSLKLFF